VSDRANRGAAIEQAIERRHRAPQRSCKLHDDARVRPEATAARTASSVVPAKTEQQRVRSRKATRQPSASASESIASNFPGRARSHKATSSTSKHFRNRAK
jgi:hypothetical protein